MERVGAAVLGREMGEAVAAAQTQLNQIASVRGRVLGQRIPVGEALSYYTDMNGRFLDAVSAARKLDATPRMGREVAAYTFF